MEIGRACDILSEMAKERNIGVLEVLQEWDKFANDEGEASHFWPDQNTACRVFMRMGRKFFEPV